MSPQPHSTSDAAAQSTVAVNPASDLWQRGRPCMAITLASPLVFCSILARMQTPTLLATASIGSLDAEAAAAAAMPSKQLRHQVRDDVERLMVNATLLFSRASLSESSWWRRGVPRDHHDSGESFRLIAVPQRRLYVVGWRPFIGQHRCPDGSIVEVVHHLNLFGTSAENAKRQFRDGVGTVIQTFHSDEHKRSFVASYDRGSRAYHFPRGVGLAIGPGTRCEALVLEHHILAPPCWDFDRQPATTDISGFELFVMDKQPERLAAIVGFMDESMNLKPGQGIVDEVSIAPSQSIQHLFFGPSINGAKKWVPRLAKGSPLELMAIHLHTHSFAGSKWFEIVDENGKSIFMSKEEPAGYGPELQSMFNLPDLGWPRLMLRPGITLKQHCSYDTNKLTHALHDGVGYGDEMCGALFIVAGYTDERRIPHTVLSSDSGEVRPRAVGSVPKFFHKSTQYGF